MFSKHSKKKKRKVSVYVICAKNFLFLFFLRIFKDIFLNRKDELNICKYGFLNDYFRKKFLTRQHIFLLLQQIVLLLSTYLHSAQIAYTVERITILCESNKYLRSLRRRLKEILRGELKTKL